MDERLIECVQKYEYLYNLQHPKYMDTARKDIAWKEISEQIKLPALSCKQKWQNLRDSFRRALNKRKRKTGQAGKQIKKWKYEDEMSFVAPFYSERKTSDSVQLTSDDDPDNDNETCEIKPRTINDTGCVEAVDTVIAVDVDAVDVDEVDKNQKVVENVVQNNKPKKTALIRRVKNRTAHSASAILMAKLLNDQDKLASRRDYDELDRFFLYMSDTVKKFSLFQQALAKNKIFSIVSEMELQHLAPNCSIPSSEYAYSNGFTLSPQSASSTPPSPTYVSTS